MKNEFQIKLLITALIFLSACSKTEFAEVTPSVQTKTEIPQDPTPFVPPAVEPPPPPPAAVVPPVAPPAVVPPAVGFKMSNGVCNQNSSTNVLSCLKCDVPQILLPPQLSVKAQALADIMYLACQIPNKSDLTNFRPTKQMIIDKLNRGSEALYPETARTSQMSMVIAGLSNTNDNSLRQKMFGGLWYQPPFSDAFETYFGVTVREAKSTFCWDGNIQTPQVTGVTGLYSKAWVDCMSGNDSSNCKELPQYVVAMNYRNQLQNVLSVSISQPFVAPVPDPQKVCTWDKFEGNDLIQARIKLNQWKSQGRKIAMEASNANGVGQCGAADETVLMASKSVVLASYVCK